MKEIQVSGFKTFPENRWREAFLHYLFGMWADNNEVPSRPKVFWGPGEGFSLDEERGIYLFKGEERPLSIFPAADRRIVVTPERRDFEIGLVRFVKNDRITALVVELTDSKFLLWKVRNRGEFFSALNRNTLSTMRL